MRALYGFVVVGIFVALGAVQALADPPPPVQWMRQFPGAFGADAGLLGSVVDGAGNAYVSGYEGAGAIVAKYDPQGTRLWLSTVPGGPSQAWSGDLDASNNLYVTGTSFVAKYNSSGAFQWLKSNSALKDSKGIAVDAAGNAYAAGAVLAKYDTAGNLLWSVPTHGAGVTNGDGSRGADLGPTGNVYVSGRNFLTQYDSAGNELWNVTLSTGFNQDVAVDGSGNAYVGYSQLAKYDASGIFQWSQPMPAGVTAWNALTTDTSGNLYATGFGNVANNHVVDLYAAQYSPSGSLIWLAQIGGPDTVSFLGTKGWDIAAGPSGLYIAAYTGANMVVPNAIGPDALLIAMVPEPGSGILLLVGGALLRARVSRAVRPRRS